MENILIYDFIWNRIKEHQYKSFYQKRGGEFKYHISENTIYFDRTNWFLPRKDIEEALKRVPLKTTSEVNDLQAPSYIYAILMDERISGKLW